MSEYRIKATGEVKSQDQIKKENPNVSLPRVWNVNVFEALGIDPVLSSAKPETTGDYKIVVRNGVEQDSDNNWVYAWLEQDMFSEYTDKDDVVHTKADQEKEYQATIDAEKAEGLRTQRNELLAQTDFYALSDVTMSDEMKTYRQTLRDLPSDSDWPNPTFPDKP